MNSSDIIEDSEEENLSNLDISVEDSLFARPSTEAVVEESFAADNTNTTENSVTSNNFHTSRQNRNNSYISSDENEDYEVVTKFTRKPGIRKIVSDSEDECEHVESPVQTNYSSLNYRSSKPLDSEEDDRESTTSLTELTDSSNLKALTNDSNYFEKEGKVDLSSEIHESFFHQNREPSSSNDHGKLLSFTCDKNDSFRSHKSSSSDKSDEDIIDIHSSEDEGDIISVDTPKSFTGSSLYQPTLDSMVTKLSLTGAGDPGASKNNNKYCSAAEYANQSSQVSNLRTDILKCKNILRNTNLSLLPDQGAKLIQRQRNLEKMFTTEEEKLKIMVVDHTEPEKTQKTWDQLQTNSSYVVPKTFGTQAMNTFITQKTLTMDRLKNLHDSLATCPSEDILAEDPKGMKVELMLHQKRALAWLIWREGQKPAGGILADDMGLGKTLTMISLILFTKESDLEDNDSESESEDKGVEGGTLVICPASLINQWENEIESKLKRNLLSIELYHGNKRETRATRLAKYDVVITTYKLAQGDFEKKGPLNKIKWKRIILDEAHVIRNHKAQTSVAICELKAKSRWALTGTPVHNKELDLYALLKFLRCSPFDDLAVWKRWVANKNAGGQDRLNTVITSILLRRTKTQLQTQGALLCLPEKKFEIIEVSLDNAEKQIYQKVLIFSKTLFIQFLHQRAEKDPTFTNIRGGDLTQTNDEEYSKMHKKIKQIHGNTDVKSHEILVLLLRLRQICCHPSLISSMLDQENCVAEGIEDEGVDMDMLDKLNNLNLDDVDENLPSGDPTSFTTAANKVLSSSNPVFAADRSNEKLRVIQKIIEEKVIPNGDKIIIVSQWTSMLNLIFSHLKEAKIKCDILDGKVPIKNRNDIVVNFNNPTSKIKVLLLSLTAGGVGLNLVGANHLLLVDLHWNPQLECQAQDRIYRVGQKKIVYVYKIITSETIEERIKTLQDSKLSMAGDILAGVKPGASSKLSMDDLKMLFNIAG